MAEPSLFLVGLGTPISSLVQILLCLIYLTILNRRQKQTVPSV